MVALTRLHHKVVDLGIEGLRRGSTPEVAAAVAAINGLKYGYPSCCVEEYTWDLEHGRWPAARRGTVPTDTGRYVPCSRCCLRIGREIAS